MSTALDAERDFRLNSFGIHYVNRNQEPRMAALFLPSRLPSIRLREVLQFLQAKSARRIPAQEPQRNSAGEENPTTQWCQVTSSELNSIHPPQTHQQQLTGLF